MSLSQESDSFDLSNINDSLNEIQSNNSVNNRLTNKQLAVDEVFNPDRNTGISNWISREDIFRNHYLNWGSNGACRHGIYFGDRRYNWEKKGSRKITHLRTNGFNTELLIQSNRPIRTDIREHHLVNGCVVCGSNSSLVIDHKNDLYNDPRVLDTNTQTIEDFQCLCNHCNLQKREVARKTRETKKRYKATNILQLSIFGIDFIEGDENYDENDVNAMRGTYWYDPVAFMNFIKSQIP